MLFKGPLLHKDLGAFLSPIGQYWFGSFFFFLMPLQLWQVCLGFSPRLTVFWMLYFFKFCHVLHVLTRHFYLWRVSDKLKLWSLDFIRCLVFKLNVAEASSSGQPKQPCAFLCDLFCVVSVSSTSAHTQSWVHQHAFPVLTAFLSSALSRVFFLSSFHCYSPLAEATFSTRSIQRYFSTCLYSFWGFWCTFLIDGVLCRWEMGTHICRGSITVGWSGLCRWQAMSAVQRQLKSTTRRFHIEEKNQEMPVEWNSLLQ